MEWETSWYKCIYNAFIMYIFFQHLHPQNTLCLIQVKHRSRTEWKQIKEEIKKESLFKECILIKEKIYEIYNIMENKIRARSRKQKKWKQTKINAWKPYVNSKSKYVQNINFSFLFVENAFFLNIINPCFCLRERI